MTPVTSLLFLSGDVSKWDLSVTLTFEPENPKVNLLVSAVSYKMTPAGPLCSNSQEELEQEAIAALTTSLVQIVAVKELLIHVFQ